MTCLSVTLHSKTFQKNVSIPRLDEKKLHTWEFQLKGISGNIRYKLLQKRPTGKTTVFQTPVAICHKYLEHSVIFPAGLF